jgi:hypothetical protein
MANGKKMQEEVMVLTTIRMETSTKAIGIGICKTGLELITTPMEISTKVNGSMVVLTVRATTFILLNEGSIKATGDKAGKKDSDSLSSRINMVIQALGRIIKRTGRGPTSILTAKDTKEIGIGIKNTDREPTGTKMEIPIMENGDKITGMATVLWSTTMAPSTGVSGKKANSRAEVYLTSETATRMMENGCVGRCMGGECWFEEGSQCRWSGSVAS